VLLKSTPLSPHFEPLFESELAQMLSPNYVDLTECVITHKPPLLLTGFNHLIPDFLFGNMKVEYL